MWILNDFIAHVDSHPAQAQQVRMPILDMHILDMPILDMPILGKTEIAASQCIRASAQIGHAGELNSGKYTAQFTARLKDQSCWCLQVGMLLPSIRGHSGKELRI